MNRINYRFAIITQGAGGAPLLAVGYGNPAAALSEPAVIKSLGTAISKGMSFLRRFQANGVDSRLEVFGQVVDDGAPNAPVTPVRALTNAEKAEQVYARIDTPELGLTTRINLSNKDVNAGQPANLGGDFNEDTEDVSA